MKRNALLKTGLCLALSSMILAGYSTAFSLSGETLSAQITIQDEEIPLATTKTQVKVPESPGTKTASNKEAVVDYSNTSDGYITVKCAPTKLRIKVRVTKGTETYTYDLTADGTYTAYPLQMGDGAYTVQVLKQTTGSNYALLLSQKFDVKLSSSLAPYLIANQYVEYTQDSKTVAKAIELAQNCDTVAKVVQNSYNYVVDNIVYDYDKAKLAASGSLSGYLPNVDAILDSNKGICFDYAAVLACMLRSQNIPTKLVTGYISPNGVYHAWNEVYVENVGWVNANIYLDANKWNRMDPTNAAANKDNDNILAYIGDGKNYQQKYQY